MRTATFSEYSFLTKHITRTHQPILQDMYTPERKAESLKCHEGHFTPVQQTIQPAEIGHVSLQSHGKKGKKRVPNPHPQSKLYNDRLILPKKSPFLCVWVYVHELLNVIISRISLWAHCFCQPAVKLNCCFPSMSPPTTWHFVKCIPLMNLPLNCDLMCDVIVPPFNDLIIDYKCRSYED